MDIHAADDHKKALNEASAFVRIGQFDKALQKIEKFDGTEFEDNVWNALALFLKGVCRWNVVSRDNGLEDLEKGADLLITLPDSVYRGHTGITNILLETASYELLEGRHQKSIKYGRKYCDMMNDLKNSNAVTQKNFLIGVRNLMMSREALGLYENVEEYSVYNQGVKPLTEENMTLQLEILIYSADACIALKGYEEGIVIYNVAILLINETGVGKTYLNPVKFKLADALITTGKINEAKEIFEELMGLATESDDPEFKYSVLLRYISLKSELGNNTEALEILERYLPEFKEYFQDEATMKDIYRLLYYCQLSNGLEEEAKKTFEAYLNDDNGKDSFLALQEKRLEIIKDLQGGNLKKGREDIDNFRRDVLASGDKFSKEYASYLELEIFYSTVCNRNVEKQIADDYLRYLVVNSRPGSEDFASGIERLLIASFFDEDKILFSNYLQLYYDLTHDMLAKSFLGMGKKERELYWEKIKTNLTGNIPRFILNLNEGRSNLLGYQLALLTKGFLLRSEISVNDILSEGKKRLSYSDDLSERTEYIRSALTNKDDAAGPAGINNDEIVEMLRNESPLYADFYNKISVDVPKIRNGINEDDLCVEFLWIPNGGGHILFAYLLRKDWDTPKVETFFTSENYEIIKKEDYYKNPLFSLIIWKRLSPYTEGVRNIYFAPDGPLHEISIESLPDYENIHNLISDRWNIYRLSSTRELAARDPNSGGEPEIGLFGGMLYDEPEEELRKEYVVSDGITSGVGNDSDSTREFILSEDDLENMELRAGAKYLPETLNEVNEISRLFTSSKIRNHIFSGAGASEKNFKSLSGQTIPIIHIATHGFYWKKNSKQSRIMAKMDNPDSVTVNSEEELALRRTGLLFSGANLALKGKSDAGNSDEGILTAQEISRLRLNDVDLMVLSACETGLGDISADGVFGLQRGFKKAGVGSILMSLWKVDDKATQLLMTKFYETYLSGKSKRESLLAAQKYVREYEVETIDDSLLPTPREKTMEVKDESEKPLLPVLKERPYENPKYWAAFILLDALD